MKPWTSNTFVEKHLPHRLGVLRGFRNRSHPETHEAHCAMKDGAMITCRVLWGLMGVIVDSTEEETPYAPTVRPVFRPFEKQGRRPPKLPAGIKVLSFTEAEFAALRPEDAGAVVKVLVAANKCVAHLDERPDHGVDEKILDNVIDLTLREVKGRVVPNRA